VADDDRLFYTIDEIKENYRKAHNLPRFKLNRPNLHEIPGVLKDMQLCDVRAEIGPGSPTPIQTPPERWSWAAAIPLDLPSEITGEVWVRVRATVSQGETAFGVLRRDTDSYQDRCFVGAKPEPQTVFLEVSNPADARSLIVENSTADGKPAKLLLETVTVLQAKP